MLLVSGLMLAVGCWGESPNLARDRVPQMAAYLAERAASDFHGAVLVMDGRDVLLERAFGLADREQHVAMKIDTKLRIASLTKPLTAAAVLKLEKAGRLSLEQQLAAFLSPCPQPWATVTLYQLMTHTSGLPDWFGRMEAVPVEDTAAEFERVLLAADDYPLEFQPGEKYRYNNFNYAVLGYVIEKTSGQIYPQAVRVLVFDPIGMSLTDYDDPRPIIADRARGYNRKNGQIVNCAPKDPAGYSAGGMLSTVGDFGKWVDAVFYGDYFEKKDRERIFNAPLGYGLGWAVREAFGRKQYNHTGSTHGFSTFMAHFPEVGLSVVVFSNVEETEVRALACDLVAIGLGADRLPFGPISLEPKMLEPLAGAYRDDKDTVYRLDLIGNELHLKWRQNDLTLIPLAPHQFTFVDWLEMRLHIDRDEGNRVRGFHLTKCGNPDLVAMRFTEP